MFTANIELTKVLPGRPSGNFSNWRENNELGDWLLPFFGSALFWFERRVFFRKLNSIHNTVTLAGNQDEMWLCCFSKEPEKENLSVLNRSRWFIHKKRCAGEHVQEAAWPSGQGAGLELSPALTTKLKLFLGGPQFNSSVMLVNSQLVCLPPVGIFKPVMFIWNICFLQFEWHVCELVRCS